MTYEKAKQFIKDYKIEEGDMRMADWIERFARYLDKKSGAKEIEKLDKQLRKRGFYIEKMYKTENPNNGVEIGQEKEEQKSEKN